MDKVWKKFERETANDFGTRRQICSGSMGRDDQTASDSLHPTLFVECKYRVKHAVWSLWKATKTVATKEDKTPILSLKQKGESGHLFVVHRDDMRAVVTAWLEANPIEDTR